MDDGTFCQLSLPAYLMRREVAERFRALQDQDIAENGGGAELTKLLLIARDDLRENRS